MIGTVALLPSAYEDKCMVDLPSHQSLFQLARPRTRKTGRVIQNHEAYTDLNEEGREGIYRTMRLTPTLMRKAK